MIKELFLNRKIATKLLLYTLLFSTLITFLFTAWQLHLDYKEGQIKIEKKFQQIEQTYLLSLSYSSWVYDIEQINLQIIGILNLSNIEYVALYLQDGSVIEKGNKNIKKTLKKTFLLKHNYEKKDILLAKLVVIADIGELDNLLVSKITTILFYQSIETLLAVFFILFIFQHLLTKHISQIVYYMKSLNFETKSQPLKLNKYNSTSHKDELDELVLAINTMQDKLYSSYDALSNELIKRKSVDKSLLESKLRLEKQYMTDTLTGLANRNKLMYDLGCSLKSAMAIIDIDGFKEINDFYGHEIGDKVIVECAQRIQKFSFNSMCTIYRLHSDQFALLYENVINKTVFENKIRTLVGSLIKESIIVDQYEIPIGVATGLAVDEENLYIDTDLALKIAKKTNKNFILYNKKYQIEKEFEKNLQWTKKLKQALQDDRITAFFQPIYNLKTKKVEKCEALVRMISEKGEIISPFFFLGVAVKSKLYPKITLLMIDKVIEAAQKYAYEFSINFTIDDILNAEVKNHLINSIKKNNLEGRIVVELVESEGIDSFEEISSFIETIKELGCKIAIDDFGTGYSNFEYLLKLNADYVKIDGSLVKNIDKDKNMLLVAENIVNFAKIAGMKTIAEFVSSVDIKNVIEDIDVDYAQGYYISEPVALEDMYKFENL